MTQKRVSCGQFVNCPFCDYKIATDTTMTWCANCLTEWYISRDGEWAIFDDERQTPKFAWAKAFARAGGVSFGKRISL